MFLYKQSEQINSYLSYLQREGKRIGFVPTMGALHEGHISLIREAREKTDIVVCSIFVNPTQFDQKEDFDKYPQTLSDDLQKLEANSCDICFAPSVDEIYPGGEALYRLDMDLSDWTSKLEGVFRPGHFEGMMQVVARLLDIVPADVLVMGQKDYQQWSIVKEMVSRLGLSTEVFRAPIVREEDGLAMSSRNRRIDARLRPEANALYLALRHARKEARERPVSQLLEECRSIVEKTSFRLEYFDLVDGINLNKVHNLDGHSSVVAVTAAWLGDVRLIDNMLIKD